MVKTQPASGVEELLRAAEYLDSWDREREHGYAAVAPRSSSQQSDGNENSASGPSVEQGSCVISGNSGTTSFGQTNTTALARACGTNGVVATVMVKANGRRRRHSASGSSSSSRRLSTSSSSPDQKVRGSGKESVQNGFVRSAHNELEKSRRASMRGCLEALRHLLPTEHLERTSTGKNTTLSVLRSARSFIKALHDCLDQKVDTRAQLMSEQTKKLHRLSVLTGMVPPVTASSTSGNVDTMKLETLGTAAVAVAAAAAATATLSNTGSLSESSTQKGAHIFGGGKVVVVTNGSVPSSIGPSSGDRQPNNGTSFDESPPVSVVKPGSLVALGHGHQIGRFGEKSRSTSESSVVAYLPQSKKRDNDQKTKNDIVMTVEDVKPENVDFHVLADDSPSTRVFFVSSATVSEEGSSQPVQSSSSMPRSTVRR